MDGPTQASLTRQGGQASISRQLGGQTSSYEWTRWQQRRRPESRCVDSSAQNAKGLRSEKMARLEAAFFVAEGPLSTRKLCQFALLADISEVKLLIDELNLSYEEDGSAFKVERVASGFQLLTDPRFSHWLDQLHQRTAELKLSSPAMETLSIVAYRQPITRADIEAVRGVQCSEILKLLMERGLVKIGGEDDSLGRPYLYITTRLFLELFGLRNLDDMPAAAELRVRPEKIHQEAADLENTEETGPEHLEAEEEDEDWDDDEDEDAEWDEHEEDDEDEEDEEDEEDQAA